MCLTTRVCLQLLLASLQPEVRPLFVVSGAAIELFLDLHLRVPLAARAKARSQNCSGIKPTTAQPGPEADTSKSRHQDVREHQFDTPLSVLLPSGQEATSSIYAQDGTAGLLPESTHQDELPRPLQVMLITRIGAADNSTAI